MRTSWETMGFGVQKKSTWIRWTVMSSSCPLANLPFFSGHLLEICRFFWGWGRGIPLSKSKRQFRVVLKWPMVFGMAEIFDGLKPAASWALPKIAWANPPLLLFMVGPSMSKSWVIDSFDSYCRSTPHIFTVSLWRVEIPSLKPSGAAVPTGIVLISTKLAELLGVSNGEQVPGGFSRGSIPMIVQTSWHPPGHKFVYKSEV